jgi:hypothetical protein
MKKFFFLIIVLLLLAGSAGAAHGAVRQNIRTLEPGKTAVPPVLDGSLDDEAWKNAAVVDDVWITYNPVNGNELPQSTRAYIAYDDENLYFAFHCQDTQPDLIKTSLTKRDGIFEDDWVGLSIDTVGGKKYGYEFFVNPSGAQADIFRTGDMEDSSTDWVWYSAGKVVSDGYIVEIRQPLKSIRFASGKDVRMGVIFWRRISRLGISGSWPQLVRPRCASPSCHGRWCWRPCRRSLIPRAGTASRRPPGPGPTRPATWASPSSTASPRRSWPRPR